MRNPDRLSRYLRVVCGYLFFIVIFLLLSYLGSQYVHTLDKYINFLFNASLYSGAAYLVLGTIHIIVSVVDSIKMKRIFLYDFVITLLGMGIIFFLSYILAVISALK
jgi:hypothetical protein